MDQAELGSVQPGVGEDLSCHFGISKADCGKPEYL